MLDLDPAALSRLVERALGAQPSAVVPMPGGASTRRYLRITAGAARAVAMFVPDQTPEEKTSGAASTRWPFLEVHALLSERGVRVPRILGEACDDGLLLLEDLDDDTLGAVIERAPERREALYRQAVEDLALAQRRLVELPPESVVRSRAFDAELLRWELEHFREWGLEARGVTLAPDDRAAFDAIAERLAARIASWPRGFVHRDYQSRNLMVKGSGDEAKLLWIDFQDALLGPRVYDLVALLQDSYQAFDRPFIEARLDEFASARGLDRAERAELGREFDLVTVQRKLKDAGRFVFIDRVKKNPSFLSYVEPTLAKVRGALARLEHEPDLRELSRILLRALGPGGQGNIG
jgi:aminoglycoside/choline kinase family phosphotransferase